MKRLFCIAFLLTATAAFAVQYQATAAQTTGTAVLNGDYVRMNSGNMSWTVNVSSTGMYNIAVNSKVSDPNDNYKAQYLNINGSNVAEIGISSATWANATSVARLNQGNNTVAINNSWGYVDVRYIDITPFEKTPFDLDKNLVNPKATEAAKKVFAFMQDNFQKKVISGVMTGEVNGVSALNNQAEVRHIRNNSGNKTPALVGFDFMHGTGKEYNDAGGGWFLEYTNATITLAKELWNRGGIPHFCWHWRDPLKNSEGFYSPGKGSPETNFNLTSACTNTNCTDWNRTSAAYLAIIEDIDKVAGYLKQLQDAGVVVLWRPIHEASGTWFWWGAKGGAAFKLLYELLYTRLTTTHGLNNLIWVWNSEAKETDKAWYPGDNRVDIIGRDKYVDDHGSLIGEFETLKDIFGIKKMIALSENGPVPYPANLVSDYADWSFFMPWYGNYTTQSNTASDWNTIMNHSYVLTLEDMPGWGSTVTPSSSSRAVSSSSRAVSSSSRAVSSSSRAVSSSSRAVSSSSRAVSSSSRAVSSSSRAVSSSSRAVSSSSRAVSSSSRAISSSSAGTTPILNSQFSILNSPTLIYYTLQGQSLGNIKPKEPGVYLVKNIKTKQIQKVVVK